MSEVPPAEDPIALLRAQVRAATDAAERLVREAAASGPPPTGAPGPPPPGAPNGIGAMPPPGTIPASGWDAPGSHADAAGELQALGRLFDTVRALLPEDLQRQVTELIRQLLLVLRALIDWAVTRIETGPRGRSVEVEDIPIA